MRMLLLSMILLPTSVLAQANAPASPKTPDLDQMTIYRSFLSTYMNGGPKVSLNISRETIAFTPRDYDRNDCLAGFSDDQLKASTTEIFAADAFPNHHLVDPKKHERNDPGNALQKGDSVDHAVQQGFAHALFTFSDVVFDHDRTHAAFSYSFVCGGLCGHGGTVIFEKRDGQWAQSKRRCGSWIS